MRGSSGGRRSSKRGCCCRCSPKAQQKLRALRRKQRRRPPDSARMLPTSEAATAAPAADATLVAAAAAAAPRLRQRYSAVATAAAAAATWQRGNVPGWQPAGRAAAEVSAAAVAAPADALMRHSCCGRLAACQQARSWTGAEAEAALAGRQLPRWRLWRQLACGLVAANGPSSLAAYLHVCSGKLLPRAMPGDGSWRRGIGYGVRPFMAVTIVPTLQQAAVAQRWLADVADGIAMPPSLFGHCRGRPYIPSPALDLVPRLVSSC